MKQRLKTVLQELLTAWAEAKKYSQPIQFLEFIPHDIGERKNPVVRFSLGGTESLIAAEEMLRDIGHAIAREDEQEGKSVTTKGW